MDRVRWPTGGEAGYKVFLQRMYAANLPEVPAGWWAEPPPASSTACRTCRRPTCLTVRQNLLTRPAGFPGNREKRNSKRRERSEKTSLVLVQLVMKTET